MITVSGGAGVLISDVADAVGLPMPEMPADTQKMLRDLVPFCAPRNPVDATAQVSNNVALIETFTEAMVKDGGYASVLGLLQHDRIVAPLAGNSRADQQGARPLS